MISFFADPVKEARKIQEMIDYRVLKAVWDYYFRVKRKDLAGQQKIATPAWFGLFAVQNHKGKFDQFETEELHLLTAFLGVKYIYDDIIASLEEHAEDKKMAAYILETHPSLSDAIPEKYDNIDDINQYLISVIRQYQKMLDQFYTKFKNPIDNAIKKIEEKLAKGVVIDHDDNNFVKIKDGK